MNASLYTTCSRKLAAVLAGLTLFTLLTATPHLALSQPSASTEAPVAPPPEGFLLRVGGDAQVGAHAQEAVVVVVGGDAVVAGAAEVLVVVNGTATLAGARVGELVVVDGAADVQEGTVIAGDVQLIDARLTRSEEAVVQGRVHYGFGWQFGLMVFGFFFGLGVVLTILASGLIAAAVAPRAVRAAGAVLTDHFGQTLLATLGLWIGLPLVAVFALATIVGIPAGLGVFIFLLPALGFLGYLVAGIRLGDYVLGVVRGSDEAWHPYQAAIVGLLILLVVAWLPFVGPVVSPAAALLGSGALALRMWRAARQPGPQAPDAATLNPA